MTNRLAADRMSKHPTISRRRRSPQDVRARRPAGWLVAVIALAGIAGCGSTGQNAPKTPPAAPAAKQITFYLALPARARTLVRDALAQATPGHPRYRHFASVRRLASTYGASADTMQRVVKDVETFGLDVSIDPSRLFARVSGTAEQWASALQGPLRERPASRHDPFITYSLPDQTPAGLPPRGTTWLFSDTTIYDPSVDPRRAVSGLARARGALPPIGTAARPWPRNSGTVGGHTCKQPAITAGEVYTPSQIQTAYGAIALAPTAGSTVPTIDVIDLGGGWNPSDLSAASACFGYGPVNVRPAEGDGVLTPIRDTDAETSLDLQTTAAMAPNAAIDLIQSSDGPAAMLAMTGTSTFIAAGDTGSTTCPGLGLIPTLSFPAVSPVVTAVGGTRLTLDAHNRRTNEVAWNDSEYGQPAAGGGGPSLSEPRPPYQNIVNAANTRAVPDLSALAAVQPGWPVFLDGTLQSVGGTSGSTPFIAAATALVDAQQLSQHRPRIGLANGWFYHAAQRNPASFYDVTQGNNRLKLVNCCAATPGYDLASGLGVPDWAVLPNELPDPAK